MDHLEPLERYESLRNHLYSLSDETFCEFLSIPLSSWTPLSTEEKEELISHITLSLIVIIDEIEVF